MNLEDGSLSNNILMNLGEKIVHKITLKSIWKLGSPYNNILLNFEDGLTHKITLW